MSNGSIKGYTPRFKLIIPQFNIATWHDYIEANFRNIDALFFNLFDINQYKGQWTNLTLYNVGDVVFVGEDKLNGEQTIYEGRLVKVLVEHTTDDSEYFSEYLEKHPDYYELFADASTAQYYAQQVKQALEDAQTIVDQSEEAATNAQSYAQSAQNSKNLAQTAATNAQSSEQNSQQSANLAEQYKNETSAIKNDTNEIYNNVLDKLSSKITKTIQTDDWIEGTEQTDAGFVHKYELISQKDLTDAVVYAIFDVNDAISGNFSPTLLVDSNKISLFCKTIPANEINVTFFISFVQEL